MNRMGGTFRRMTFIVAILLLLLMGLSASPEDASAIWCLCQSFDGDTHRICPRDSTIFRGGVQFSHYFLKKGPGLNRWKRGSIIHVTAPENGLKYVSVGYGHHAYIRGYGRAEGCPLIY